MRGIAHKALRRGFNVVRLNQRNCGGTESLSRGLYHSGPDQRRAGRDDRTGRPRRLPRLAVAGYSLGGNLALKLAGNAGDAPPPWLRAVCAVSPTLELGVCMDAMEQGINRIYEWHFMRSLRGQDPPQGAPVPRTLRHPRRVEALEHPRIRRSLHGAASRVQGRVRLLPPGRGDARGGPHPRPHAHHHGRGRPLHPGGAVPRRRRSRATRTSRCASRATAGTAATSRTRGTATTATGPSSGSSTSSPSR